MDAGNRRGVLDGWHRRREGADRSYIVRHINMILTSLPQASTKPCRARSIPVAGDQSGHVVGGSEASAWDKERLKLAMADTHTDPHPNSIAVGAVKLPGCAHERLPNGFFTDHANYRIGANKRRPYLNRSNKRASRRFTMMTAWKSMASESS